MVNSLATGKMITYPIYIISKGRWQSGLTAKFLIKDEIPFRLVVEPQEVDNYLKEFGRDRIHTLPFSNLGLGGIPARNWVWEHAKESGAKRHWILDDNIAYMATLKKGKRVRCHSREAFEKIEEFTDRYSNIGITGINYWMFGFRPMMPPFYLNHHAYSCLLIQNGLPFRWRGRYNEDTDLCLQALTSNWCTVNINAYLIYKMPTMTCKGGNTDELYVGNGRFQMSRSLEHQWLHRPGLVKTTYKFGRPQHHVNWRVFANSPRLEKIPQNRKISREA